MTTTITALATPIIRLKANGPLTPVQSALYRSGKNDQGTLCSSDMAQIHNVLFRGYNSIYQQAPYVHKSDYSDFIRYALVWYDFIEVHHTGEEEDLFPKIEEIVGQKDFMGVAVEQHAVFHNGIERYKKYLDLCAADPASFDPQKLLDIMDSFGSALHTHLTEEPELLLRLGDFDHDFLAMFGEHGKHVMGKLSPWNQLAFLWVNHDTEFEGGLWKAWPPAPKPVVWVMRNVITKWNMRWWRFGATDVQGRPQQYLALREEYRNRQ